MSDIRQPFHPVDPLFTRRWSPRAFSGERISDAQLFTLLEAARWAPSAYNYQPWRFVIAHRETPAWQGIFEALVPFNQGWAQRAAALVVVASLRQAQFPGKEQPTDNPWHSFDAGAAWVSLAFQATLSGLAAHATAGFERDKLRQAIALPDELDIETVVVIGQPGDKSLLPEALQAREQPNDRKPLAELISVGRYGR